MFKKRNKIITPPCLIPNSCSFHSISRAANVAHCSPFSFIRTVDVKFGVDEFRNEISGRRWKLVVNFMDEVHEFMEPDDSGLILMTWSWIFAFSRQSRPFLTLKVYSFLEIQDIQLLRKRFSFTSEAFFYLRWEMKKLQTCFTASAWWLWNRKMCAREEKKCRRKELNAERLPLGWDERIIKIIV